MKALYYTARDMTDPYSGINTKITTQAKTLRKRGYTVDFAYREQDSKLYLDTDGGKILVRQDMKRPFKVSASKYLCNYLEKENIRYDAVYIRYVYCDRAFMRLLRYLKGTGAKIVVEIPTFPYDPELKDNLENRVVLLLDKRYRNSMQRYVDRVVTYSDHTSVFGIPTICTKNGIDFDLVKPVQAKGKTGDSIGLVAVAALMKWHGYDRLIRGMGEYYKKGGQRNIMFHLVGDGELLEFYRGLIDEYGLGGHVVFYGFQNGQALDEIYEKADIAVDSLGDFRKNLKQSSSLKTREYAAKGLPVVMTCKMDIFPDDWKYQLVVPNDDSNLDMEKVVRFYDTVRGDIQNGVDVHGMIRAEAEKEGSMESTFHEIFAFFEGKDGK